MSYILYSAGFASNTVEKPAEYNELLQLMLYLQVYFTDVVVHVKVYLSSGQKMHLELVHFLLKGLEGLSHGLGCMW